MKNKKLNIILIPLVTILWIIITTKILTYSKSQNSESVTSHGIVTFSEPVIVADTVNILADYHDPFKSGSVSLNASITVLKPSISKEIKPSTETIWPKIKYSGLVKNIKGGREYILISISDKILIVEKKNEIDGLKILQIYPDSLLIQFQGKTKTFIKK